MKYKRRNITLTIEEDKVFADKAKELGISVSALMRLGAHSLEIKKQITRA